MEKKGMIPPGQWRIIWKSPMLPNDPYTMPAWLPEQMRTDFKNVMMKIPQEDPVAYHILTDGGDAAGFNEETINRSFE